MSEQLDGDEPREVKRNFVDFDKIAAAALRAAEGLVKAWLPDGRREGDEWSARNPTRSDRRPGSFKINLRTGEWADFAAANSGGDLISLRAYLDSLSQLEAAKAIAAELGLALESEKPAGLTLEAYAQAKKLPVAFLRELGVETIANPYKPGAQAIAIPYRKRDGSLLRNRIRQALHKPRDGKDMRMLWDKDKDAGVSLYGLDQLERSPAKGCPVLLVEGESDVQTLWLRGYDGVGVPGANNYKPARDDKELEGFDVIAIVEPDAGGEALLKRLSQSKLREAIRAVWLQDFGYKDVSELHLNGDHEFDDVLQMAIACAEPLDAVLQDAADVVAKPEKTATAAANGTVAETAKKTKSKASRTVGDDEDGDADKKPSQADTLVKLTRNAAEIFTSPDDTAYARITVGDHKEVWAIRSRGFKLWLTHTYYTLITGQAPNADAINQAQATFEAVAAVEGQVEPVHVRRGARKTSTTSTCATRPGAPSRSTPQAGGSSTIRR